ncbi:MAG: PHP domain-containing protein [Halanaerobiales bacterium]
MTADLHLHSTYSDGSYTPRELIKEAANLNINPVAITDHDTVEGIEPGLRAAKDFDVDLIPAIEFSTFSGKAEIHILGYYIDYKNDQLLQTVEKIFNARLERAKKMVKLLNQQDINISYDQVKKLAGDDYVGRPHVARAMVEEGYISEIGEAFSSNYIGNGGRAYVAKYKITPTEAIKLIKKVKGIPVLAHPYFINHGDPLSFEDIYELKQEGLLGVEVYHSKHTAEATSQYLKIAKELDLLITGGTDFHGENSPEIKMGDILLENEHIERLKSINKKI